MHKIFLPIIFAVFASFANAQTGIQLNGLNVNANEPIETTADSLNIDQNTGKTVFQGNVLIGQGDLRLSANTVELLTAQGAGIQSFKASGNVLLTTLTDALEADTAEYDLAQGTLTMRGNVLLSQGNSAVMSDSALIFVDTGTATFNGNVRTLLQTGNAQ